jgi:hypothetical protein
MGLFGKDKRETCGACGRKFDDHDVYEDHITNIHPKTKPCTKCSGIAFYSYKSISQDIDYICIHCGFVVETWKTDEFRNHIWQEKDRSKPAWK